MGNHAQQALRSRRLVCALARGARRRGLRRRARHRPCETTSASSVHPRSTRSQPSWPRTSAAATAIQDAEDRADGQRRRHQGVLRRRRRAASRHRQLLAANHGERSRGLRQERRRGDRRGQDRLRRHRAREREGRAALSADAARGLPRAREGRAGSRRRRRSSCRIPTRSGREINPTLPADDIEVLGSAADVGHARRVQRARHGRRLQDVRLGCGTAARRRTSRRATCCATTAITSTPARTTT